MILNFEQLLQAAEQRGPKFVALAAAADEAALTALLEANKAGLAQGRLFGNRRRIGELLQKYGSSESDFLAVEDILDEAEAARAAVASIRDGQSQILLKGKVQTSAFLRAVLDSERGLRTGRLLSDVFICEDPRRTENRLLMITDGGVNLAPNLQDKIAILENAVAVAHKLGNPNPKVAVVSAVETIHPELSSSVDAALMTKMNERGQIKYCVVEGPLALDNAVSPQAAEMKQLQSPVAGRAEILVCPTIEAANLLAKSTTYFAGFRLAHVIVGASAPVLIPSRADSSDAKLLSIALGVLMCD